MTDIGALFDMMERRVHSSASGGIGRTQQYQWNRPVTSKDKKRFIELAKDGHTQMEIGAIAGFSQTTVGKVLRKAGINDTRYMKAEANRNRVAELIAKGLRNRDISCETGLSESRVCILKQEIMAGAQ